MSYLSELLAEVIVELLITILAVVLFTLCAPLSEAKAQSSDLVDLETVPCPKFIAFPEWGQYTQARKNKNILCLRNRKEAKQNFSRCRKDCGPGFSVNTEPFFFMSESGPSNTPAFSIRKRSGVLYYDYDGDADFSIELIEFSSGKTVDQLVKVKKGPVSGTTYIHDRGTFYLKITPGSSSEPASWVVDFDSTE